MSETELCPRCMVNPPEKFGTSRTDSATHICTACNTAEALDDFLMGTMIPQDQWPVRHEVKTFPLKSERDRRIKSKDN